MSCILIGVRPSPPAPLPPPGGGGGGGGAGGKPRTGDFESISAVLAGIAELRRVIADARERRSLHGTRTTLFVDEVHRWNKAQQDALLPHVEDGTLTFVGATTENPYFEVIGALVSRSRVFQLRPLSDKDVRRILAAALADGERGYGRRPVRLDDEGLDPLGPVPGGG